MISMRRRQGGHHRVGRLAAFGLAVAAVPALAQDAAPAEAESDLDEAIRLAPITVIGSEEGERTLAGSGTYVGVDEITRLGYDDINRVMRRVPGVIVRPEDGYGLFPNLSLRGVDTTRSAKVTIMEDGVLAAPAPYAAPAAYYSPTAGRMHAIEVLKGSSQVRFGPHTTGGAVNYISTPIPDTRRGFARIVAGGDGETRLFANYGGWWDSQGFGRFGILLEGYRRETDGFKTIDRAPDFSDGDDTGFTKTEPMIKLAWEPVSPGFYQRVDVKWGRTDLEANETYLGLSEDDFDADPNRRYAASRFDEIDTEQDRWHVRWYAEPNEDLDLTLTLYGSSFDRDWFKLKDVRDAGGARLSLSEALAAGGSHLRTIRGEAAGELRVRHNARTYTSSGYEAAATYRFENGDVLHELTGGIRVHTDRIRRFQRDENFTQAANGAITARDPGTPGDAGNRRQRTDSVALWLQDEIGIDRLTLTPGIRMEDLRLDHTDFDDLSTRGRDRLDMKALGIGGTWEHDDLWTFFGGVHEGFSPPSPRAHVKDGLDEETSLGYELGARYEDHDEAFRASATLFRTDLDDLIVLDNLGGAGNGESENVGEVRTRGVEFSVQWDPSVARGWEWSNPWFATATYTDAEQRSDSSSTDAESIFAGGRRGADVPYVPDWAFSVGTGLERGNWAFDVSGTYVAETYTTASNTSAQIAPDGSPDSRFGETDSYFVVDVSARYRASETVTLIGGIQNLFDEEYLVSRHPDGPRPGKPVFGWVGLEIEF